MSHRHRVDWLGRNIARRSIAYNKAASHLTLQFFESRLSC